MKHVLAAALLLASAGLLPAAKNLEVYFIDVEGGQATLLVSPSGESLLIDTGWSGNNKRDAERIAAAAKNAGVKKIDYLMITHYHTDHVGGVSQLAGLLPIRNGWNPTVREGDRATRGMPGFAASLSQETTDAILAYIIKRANDEKAAQEAAAGSSTK